MKRNEIVQRINQKLYEELYSFEDIKYDLDDAIIAINNTMHTNFPMISEVLTGDESTYSYVPEGETEAIPYFPEQYMRSVVIEFTVSTLLRRQGDLTNEYYAAVQAYENGLNNMFARYYDKVPAQFQDENSGIIPLTPHVNVMETDEDGQPVVGSEETLDSSSTELIDDWMFGGN